MVFWVDIHFHPDRLLSVCFRQSVYFWHWKETTRTFFQTGHQSFDWINLKYDVICANKSLKNVIFDMRNLLRGIFTVHVESEFQILKNLLFFFWHWWMKESLLDFIKDYCTWNALNFSFYTQIVSHKVNFDTGSSPEVGNFFMNRGPVTKLIQTILSILNVRFRKSTAR